MSNLQLTCASLLLSVFTSMGCVEYEDEGFTPEDDNADVIVSQFNLWPKGDIYLLMQQGYERTPMGKKLIEAATTLESKTPIRINFVYDPHQTYGVYTTVTALNGDVGGSSTPGTTMKQGTMATTAGSAKHELGHVIGLRHTQQRSDRDANIVVHFPNISNEERYPFAKQPYATTLGPYDVNSIMHYSSFAFSYNGCATMTIRHSPVAEGQRDLNLPSACVYPKDLPENLRIRRSTEYSDWNLASISQMYCEPSICGANCASAERCSTPAVAQNLASYKAWQGY